MPRSHQKPAAHRRLSAGKSAAGSESSWVHLITICVGCPCGFLGVLPCLFPFAFICADENAARELQSEERGSPVVTWMLFRNPQHGEAERGSLRPRTEPGLLTDSVFIPLLEILPRLMQEPQPVTPYHSNPGAVFLPVQSRDLIRIPSPFYPPGAQKQQEHSLARCTQESSHPARTEPTCWHQKQALGGPGRLELLEDISALADVAAISRDNRLLRFKSQLRR